MQYIYKMFKMLSKSTKVQRNHNVGEITITSRCRLVQSRQRKGKFAQLPKKGYVEDSWLAGTGHKVQRGEAPSVLWLALCGLPYLSTSPTSDPISKFNLSLHGKGQFHIGLCH